MTATTERVDAYEEIRRRALHLVEKSGIDPGRDRDMAREMVVGAVDDYQRRAQLGMGKVLHDPSGMIDRVLQSVADFGPLTGLLARPDIEEIFLEGSTVTYLDASGHLRRLDSPTSEGENRQTVDRLLADTDRRLDSSSPIAQARVLGGSARLTAVIPPVADRLSATIRRYALRRETLESLVALGSISASAADFLELTMRVTSSVIVSGPPGAGKTSLLAALMQAVPPRHCVRCCEEVRELHVPLVHGSYYEARPPGLDGGGAVDLRQLVKVVLAMRPDRIVVGEVRGAEAFELTRAVNAGCGFACTIHANSAAEALAALVNAALMAGENVPATVVRNVFAGAIDVVVHLDRDSGGAGGRPVRRQVMEVLALAPPLHEDFTVEPLFLRERLGAPLQWTGALPPAALAARLQSELGDETGLSELLGGRGSLP
jgi:pilus assembly protein CpaF